MDVGSLGEIEVFLLRVAIGVQEKTFIKDIGLWPAGGSFGALPR